MERVDISIILVSSHPGIWYVYVTLIFVSFLKLCRYSFFKSLFYMFLAIITNGLFPFSFYHCSRGKTICSYNFILYQAPLWNYAVNSNSLVGFLCIKLYLWQRKLHFHFFATFILIVSSSIVWAKARKTILNCIRYPYPVANFNSNSFTILLFSIVFSDYVLYMIFVKCK